MINLILVEDHGVVREALSELLEGRGTYSVVAQARDGEELLALLKSQSADLILMDVAMPRLDGLSTLSRMSQQPAGNPPVLILTADERESSVRAALKAGAKGYLPKNADVEELEFAISSIISGRVYLSPSITAPLMTGDGSNLLENPFKVLTKRELEIVRHLSDGKPNREIGKELHISTRTVDTHRSNILKKLKIRTNAELVRLAITHGIVEI